MVWGSSSAEIAVAATIDALNMTSSNGSWPFPAEVSRVLIGFANIPLAGGTSANSPVLFTLWQFCLVAVLLAVVYMPLATCTNALVMQRMSRSAGKAGKPSSKLSPPSRRPSLNGDSITATTPEPLSASANGTRSRSGSHTD